MKGLSSSAWEVQRHETDAALSYHCYRDGSMVGFVFIVTRALSPQQWHAHVYVNLLDRVEEDFTDLRKAIEWVESVSAAVKAME